VLDALLPLFLQDSQFLAKPIGLLFIQYQPALVTKTLSEQLVSIHMFFTFYELQEPFFNLFVAYFLPVCCKRITGARPASLTAGRMNCR
jgi:hypothetical protein